MTRLMVLGLLLRKPMHGYEMRQWMEGSRTDSWARILPGSIYHALKQMQKEGLVQIHSSEQTGHRTRAIYEITSNGEQEFVHLLKEAWQDPQLTISASLYTALTYLSHLSMEDVLEQIDQKINYLQQQLDAWEYGESVKMTEPGMQSIVSILFANGKEHIALDIKMLQELKEMLTH